MTPDTRKETRHKLQEKVKRGTTRYEWLNFDGVVQAEGGGAFPSEACLKGSVNVMLDCIEKGPKYVRVSTRSKRLEFKYRRDIEENVDQDAMAGEAKPTSSESRIWRRHVPIKLALPI